MRRYHFLQFQICPSSTRKVFGRKTAIYQTRINGNAVLNLTRGAFQLGEVWKKFLPSNTDTVLPNTGYTRTTSDPCPHFHLTLSSQENTESVSFSHLPPPRGHPLLITNLTRQDSTCGCSKERRRMKEEHTLMRPRQTDTLHTQPLKGWAHTKKHFNPRSGTETTEIVSVKTKLK